MPWAELLPLGGPGIYLRDKASCFISPEETLRGFFCPFRAAFPRVVTQGLRPGLAFFRRFAAGRGACGLHLIDP